jgi:hypothetical protein
MDRLIRAKKPYAAAAAAALLIGTTGLALGYASPYAAINDNRINDGIKDTKTAADAFAKQETKFKSMEEDSRKTQARVKMIIAGQEERLNWPRFFEVETAVMPRPGANGNLNGDTDQIRLWRGESDAGVAAHEWFQRRMRTGVPIEQALADAQSKEPQALAMVNVEAVNTRWVFSVPKFLEAVDTQVKDAFNEDIADYLKEEERERDDTKGRFKPKAPEGPGWVVEIRGYTDHKEGQRFIRNALLKNLQKFDTFAKGEDKVGRYIVGVQDPIKGKVSHAFTYKVWMVDDAQSNTFVNINQSFLDRLLSSAGGGSQGSGSGAGPKVVSGMGGAGGAGGPTAAGPMGAGSAGGAGGAGGGGGEAPTALGPAWSGLAAGGGAEGAGGFGGPGGKGPGGPANFGSAMGGPGLGRGPGAPPAIPAGNGDASKGTSKEERRRFEFVVMLIWREPVPSSADKP